jgi:deoxyribodipyrimidine photolyase-related protein
MHQSTSIGSLLQAAGVKNVEVVDPCDDWLLSRLTSSCAEAGVQLVVRPDTAFLTSPEVEAAYFKKRKLFFTEFYIRQRKRLEILVSPQGEAIGGKWTFDTENRKKLPKDLLPPAPWQPAENNFVAEARRYVRENFPKAQGKDETFRYPVTYADAQRVLTDFIQSRLPHFGDYEDAISAEHPILFHSTLTPALNIGLLEPREILDTVLKRASDIPLNSLEGFVRQVIGWREYIRLVYLSSGRMQRSRNFLGACRSIPASFYSGSTGITPFDRTIERVHESAYCHHIERLMVLGNFMMLCDINPDAVYQWFMELFIDAYDWVMVPNVYGMSQYAAGPHMTTKPYMSGSNYILKMSDYKRGPWCETWDALYWRFVYKHRDWLRKNPRLGMMTSTLDKMGKRLTKHLTTADRFLERFA